MATPHSKPATASGPAASTPPSGRTPERQDPFFSITFSRPYKDAQGNWKNSSSYGLNDLDSLSTLAEMAKDWVRGHTRP